MAAAATLALVGAGHASATIDRYQASITPPTATAGSTTTSTLTIKSLSIVPFLGSVNVTIPGGWSNVSVGSLQTLRANGQPINKGWTASIVGSTIQLRSTASLLSRLFFLESVKVAITGKAPCAAGSSVWTTAARSSSTFSGFGLSILGAQPSTSISGSCADHLAFTAQPPLQSTAGATFAVTVQVQDAQNQPVTTPTPVSIAIGTPDPSGGTATLTGGGQQTVAGSATFNLSIDKAENAYTLVASAPSLPHPNTTSSSFDIVISKTVINGTPGQAVSGSTCDTTSAAQPVCASVTLGNGANGPVNVFTGAPPGDAPAGSNSFTSATGNFKDAQGHPLYTAAHPALITIQVDASLVPPSSESARSLLSEGGPHPPLDVFAQLASEPYFLVQHCLEPEEGEFDNGIDGDESFPEGQKVCLGASRFDGSGNAIFEILFFDDPRWATK